MFKIIPIHTKVLNPPQDNLYQALAQTKLKLQEGDILCVTSKVVSIHEGRCIPIEAVKKIDLIRQEADYVLPGKQSPAGVIITIKQHTLIPNAGIDESNAAGFYVLWPKDAYLSANRLWQNFRVQFRLKNLGVIITDSHTIPLRWGTVGISIGHYGFKPLHDYRGEKDIFGRQLKITQANIADALAAATVAVMGEGAEQIPATIVRGFKPLRFINRSTKNDLVIAKDQDIYRPLLKVLHHD